MRSRWTLRRRIVAAYVLLACVVCGAFASAAVFAVKIIEERLIDQRLARTADQFLEKRQAGKSIDLPSTIAIYQEGTIPPSLKDLAPGTHEIPVDGVSVNVLVRDVDGARFILTDNDADFERIKDDVYAVLAAAFLACLALAVVLGRFTASRVIAPVTALARAVEKDEEGHDFPSLGSTDEMGVLARAFAARTEELQGFLNRERWFVGDVSHELRTPLTVMLGAAEILCARVSEQPELLAVAERIRRVAADTTERVSAMLLLSRAPETVGAPRIALSPIIRAEMERCQPLIAGKPVELVLHASREVYVFARPELVAIAVGNLIRNACQFTEQGCIGVTLEERRVVVEDTGVGIAASMRERVFERHVRASADTSTGSGLGLAIVRRVMEHLGWSVSHEDRAGGGSRFVLTLPSKP